MAIYTPSQSKSTYGNIVIGQSNTSTSPITITGAGSSYASGQVLTVSNGTTGATTWSNTAKTTAKGQLHLEGENADLVMNGVSLKDLLNGITDRLAILQPKPDMLEKYDNLRQAYEHYKTLEALLYDEESTTGK